MKIILSILGIIIMAIIGFFAWFFVFFLKVPPLEIPVDVSETEKIEHIDQWFQLLQEEYKFNGVVLLAKEGKAQLAKGYGYTNYKKETLLTAQSSLRLASVSKQFTAAGILCLKERGKLKLDDVVVTYIADFPYPEVTIRQLLNQTSGIPDIYLALADASRANIPVLTNEIAVDLLIKEARKATNTPGEAYAYSNTNYILLARIIELITQLSFEDFMQKALFEPLGMKNTRVWNLQSSSVSFKNKADDFENFEKGSRELKPSFIDGVAGDGAVFSSVEDLLIWDQFWYNNKLISQATLQEAFKEPILGDGTLSDYGFGWVLLENGMWHNGAWLGANTVIKRNTKEKTCLAILDNSSNIFFDNILEELKTAGVF